MPTHPHREGMGSGWVQWRGLVRKIVTYYRGALASVLQWWVKRIVLTSLFSLSAVILLGSACVFSSNTPKPTLLVEVQFSLSDSVDDERDRSEIFHRFMATQPGAMTPRVRSAYLAAAPLVEVQFALQPEKTTSKCSTLTLGDYLQFLDSHTEVSATLSGQELG